MWQDFLLAPLKDNLEDSNGVNRKDLWCTVAIREVLCRNLTLMQRYCLWKADHISKLTVSRKQVADGHSIMPLFEAPYYLIGQSYAVREVLETITSNLLWESKNPVVLLFTDPSGHGKTELAKRMGDLLSIDSLTVDCATARFETDLFGPQAPYHGCEEGTPLNNYLAKVAGQRAVVFLDEFDKTTSAVRQAMLLLFESGHYNDRRNHQKLDCKNIIWILATNLGTELIRKFAAQHVQDHYQEQQKKVPFDDLRGSVRQIVSDALGAPLTGRLTEIVPFLPFNQDEQAVATYKFMRKRRMQVRGAIDIEAKSFLKHIFLNLVDDGEIAKHLAAKSYNPELGARSLSSAVNREIGRKVSDHFQEGTRKTDNEMNNVALPKYDVRVTRDSNAIGRIVVKRVGFKEVQCKPKAVVEE
jgi:ATP-dependent Clp protease ATP-binding subunit ClpB